MKHQGKEGFTWDSKAEEWAAWAASYADLRQFERDKWLAEWGEAVRPAKIDTAAYMNACAEYASRAAQQANHHAHIARHTPTSQWSDPDPYRAISWRDYPPSGVKVWPAVVLLLVTIALFVWFAG